MENYHIFPFRYCNFENKVLLVNECSEFLFISKEDFEKLLSDPNNCSQITVQQLKEKFFIAPENEIENASQIVEIKKRTKHSYLTNDVLLLMIVPTISCNCNCVYCQVNSKAELNQSNDMSFDNLCRFCDFVFALPHKEIKIEFQGGEPLLAFELIQFIVKRVIFFNRKYKKIISFVICTNLLSLNRAQINFIKKHNIEISTSIDGPSDCHNKNRPSKKYSSVFMNTVANINKLRNVKIFPSALVTITTANLGRMREIIDTYIRLGFTGIFLRPLNNYGQAYKNHTIKYDNKSYFFAYKDAVNYIIQKNYEGIDIKEEYFNIILRKLFTPFNDGFVDMQNPCALGQMCMIVDQNGDIYPCDEARMISEMGDKYWKMGNISDKFCFLYIDEKQKQIKNEGKIEKKQYCSDCIYQVFCFTDPIKDYYIEKYSDDDYCGIKKEMFEFVFSQINNADDRKIQLFRKWAND